MPLFGPGGDVVAAIELAVSDLELAASDLGRQIRPANPAGKSSR
jgi:hypothetical protein